MLHLQDPTALQLRLFMTGADIVGVNCSFDPDTSLQTIKLMKQGLEDAGLGHTYLMAQPVGYRCPDAVHAKDGYHVLPEAPLGKKKYEGAMAFCLLHYNGVIMGTMASQITSLTIVYSAVYSDASKLRVTGLCVLNSSMTGEFSVQMASNAENISI